MREVCEVKNAFSKKLRNLKAADATAAGIIDRVCRLEEFVTVSKGEIRGDLM